MGFRFHTLLKAYLPDLPCQSTDPIIQSATMVVPGAMFQGPNIWKN